MGKSINSSFVVIECLHHNRYPSTEELNRPGHESTSHRVQIVSKNPTHHDYRSGREETRENKLTRAWAGGKNRVKVRANKRREFYYEELK